MWSDLVEQAGLDHPFLSHAWVRTWWECFGAGKELHILVVRAGSEAIAIAPLMLSRARMYGVKVRRLESIGNDHTPRFDFIIARRPEETLRAIWSSLSTPRPVWDVLRLSELPGDSRTLEELPRLAAREGFRVGRWRSLDAPYLPFSGQWEEYFKRLSRNHRSKVRKGLNRLSRLGTVELEVIASAEELVSALEDGLRIEAAAWKGEAGSAIRSRPEAEAFYTTLAQRMAGAGLLRLLFLTLDRSRIAFAYAVGDKKKLYVLKAGYDPRYGRYSPYNVLCDLVFRDASGRGLTEYEFLGGDDEWKLQWTRHTRPHHWLFVFPGTLRARLLFYAKFRLIPRLQRHRLYRALRDAASALKRRSNLGSSGDP